MATTSRTAERNYKMKTYITNWFDIKNIEHIKAWMEFNYVTGEWPKGFIPKGMIFPTDWNSIIKDKLVKVFCEHLIKESEKYDNETNKRLDEYYSGGRKRFGPWD